MRYLIPLHLWQLKTLLRGGLINLNIFFLKTPKLATLQKLKSNLFHSITVTEKTFEKVMFIIK